MMETPEISMPPSRSNSERVVDEQERRMNNEIDQLLVDIRRIGPTHPEPSPRVLFGELFDDDEVQQNYEALVGTLKSAKKRGVVNFKGQMLLKGIHDKVVISIVEDERPFDAGLIKAASNGTLITLPTPEVMTPTPFCDSSVKSTRIVAPKLPLSARSCSPKKFIFATPAEGKQTGKEGGVDKSKSSQLASDYHLATKNSVGKLGSIDGRHTSPIPRVMKSSQKVLPPPTPWSKSKKDEKAFQSKRHIPVSKSCRMPQLRNQEKETDENKNDKNNSNIDVAKEEYNKARSPVITKSSTPANTSFRMVTPTTDLRRSFSTPTPIKASTSKSQSCRSHSDEAASRVEDEVHQIVVDIRRVGANPGEPTVRFGELFDDEDVQNTYEALVGTLRSAKRQGIIKFKGQMLLKGMHDNVVITVVE
mmetsp:Transcript_32960/g.49772  ORF Transcript_32960/g.49772 Transcript_32960/m.49772 type:complete len:419 (-) Transcript_32960:1019-2275(-)